MQGQTVRLLGFGMVAFLLGCQPFASGTQSDLALAGAALKTQPQLTQQNPQDQLVIRRLWEGPGPRNFSAASVSPDGRFMSEMDWATGHLAVMDLLSGERKLIAGQLVYGRYDYAFTPVFSPDGRQLAYTYRSEERQGYEIRTIGVDGSDQRTIVPNSGWAELQNWSDDGLLILALLWDDRSKNPPMRVGLISVMDGSIRFLKEYDDWGTESSVCALSPDGRLVAYDLSSSQRADHDIYLLPVDGGREVALLTGPADDRLLGWMPDGSGVFFYSDRELTKGIWTLRVSNGRPVGEPMLLRGDVWGLEPIGFSRDAYYYGIWTQHPQLHTAIIDPQAWRLVTPPAAIEDPSLGSSGYGVWSPDGRHLAYLRAPNGQGDEKLVIRSVAGDDSREIAVSQIEPVGLLKWTDDSQAVLILARDSSAIGVFNLDLNTGTAANIWQVETAVRPHPLTIQFSRDLKTAYFARLAEGSPTAEVRPAAKIVARDLASGREREIATVSSGIQNLLLSPDGLSLAFVDGERPENPTRLATVPTSGGEIREVYSGPVRIPTTLSWSSDGRYILFADLDAQANRFSLWRVPAAGGEPSRMELPFGNPPGLRFLTLHPDGNRIAFVSGESRSEIWVVENLPGTR
jgi:Tol biopolymer transport system component